MISTGDRTIRMRRRSRAELLIAVCATVALIAAAAVGASLITAPTADAATPTKALSNETTITRWATPIGLGAVRSAPDGHARTVAQLHYQTEDRMPEVYLVLARRGDWLRVRVPGRPNGRTGWVPAARLGTLKTVHTQLVVNRRTLRAVLRRNGRAIWRSPVGVGKPGTITPAGHFWIRERLRNLDCSSMYGPWAFATSAYADTLTDWPGGGVIGVHGTDEPQLIPGRPSHGCVRVPNDRVTALARLMPIGTPVLIV
jgi:lipoprotein-anchoring transpeptidase ErfK/SrfK